MKIQTSGIGMRELHPCDGCGGPLGPVFRVITSKVAALNKQNIDSVLGTARILGGSLALAEVMAPGANAMAEVLENEEATDRLLVCMRCYCEKTLAQIAEAKNDRRELPTAGKVEQAG